METLIYSTPISMGLVTSDSGVAKGISPQFSFNVLSVHLFHTMTWKIIMKIKNTQLLVLKYADLILLLV
jgi:hypothetical protein